MKSEEKHYHSILSHQDLNKV